MKKYRKKPVEVNALQWTGDNVLEMTNFVKGDMEIRAKYLFINTLEGRMKARLGDYIIQGINGEFYPCRESIFNETYTEVKE